MQRRHRVTVPRHDTERRADIVDPQPDLSTVTTVICPVTTATRHTHLQRCPVSRLIDLAAVQERVEDEPLLLVGLLRRVE